MKRPVYFLVKCQAGGFEISTVFINPDISVSLFILTIYLST